MYDMVISMIFKIVKIVAVTFIGIILFAVLMSLLFGVKEDVDLNDTSHEIGENNEVHKLDTADSSTVQLFKLNTSELDGVSITDIRIWKSYDDRTLVFTLSGDEEVELVDKDEENNYCKVEYGNNSGWLSCDWLIQ